MRRRLAPARPALGVRAFVARGFVPLVFCPLALVAPALVGGCAVAPPPPVASAPPPPSVADAALARDASLAEAGRADPAIGPPVVIHAADAGGPVDVATLAVPDAVLFDFGVSAPRDASGPVLDALARAIEAAPPGTLATIAGNTDAVGSDDYNQALSEARARNVVVALAARGVDPRDLRAVGFGRHRPVAGNDTADGRARNRRVEIALSPSFAANLAALATAAPLVASVPNAVAVAPPAKADTASASAISARHPSAQSIHANRPAPVRANALGPSVAY